MYVCVREVIHIVKWEEHKGTKGDTPMSQYQTILCFHFIFNSSLLFFRNVG